MKSNPFTIDVDVQKGLPAQDESIKSIWSEFEQTGSISVFLAYSQKARGFKARFENQEMFSAN